MPDQRPVTGIAWRSYAVGAPSFSLSSSAVANAVEVEVEVEYGLQRR
jgi:exonuclease I